MSTKFNEHVEMDLMFYKQYTICHFIDRASRWHLAVGVPGKTDKDRWEAMATTWLTHHGPMTELIVDGETGVTESHMFQGEMKARGIKLTVRAPQQHARYIERRGALLRHSMHVIEDQLKREGVAVTFATLLSEAVFAGNCLTFVGGVTPYQVVYGRQPAILPPLSLDEGDLEQEGVPNDRIEARTREIALQAMVETTSQARINRALRTKTTLPGDVQFELGDVVEYHRPSKTKDVSGWLGPATIIEVLGDQGQVVVKRKNEELRCRFQDTRHFIGLGMVIPELQFYGTSGAMRVVQSYLDKWTDRPITFRNDVKPGNDAEIQELHEAIWHVVGNYFGIPDAVAIRLGKGNSVLSELYSGCKSLIIYWTKANTVDFQFARLEGTKVNLRQLVGETYPNTRFIQIMLPSEEHYSVQQSVDSFPIPTRPSVLDDDGRLSAIPEEDTPLYRRQITRKPKLWLYSGHMTWTVSRDLMLR